MRGGPSDSDCKGQGPNQLKLLRHNGWGGERSEQKAGSTPSGGSWEGERE